MPNQNYLLLNEKSLAENSPHSPVIWQTTNGQLTNDNQSLYGGFNLGLHVQDNPQTVHHNRLQILQDIQQSHPHIQRINWLSQVHGDKVILVDNTLPKTVMPADAQITAKKNTALAIMTADCVPIMLSYERGNKTVAIGAIHAGWQGLAKGIIGNTVQKMQTLKNDKSAEFRAWIGACIGINAYEVDERVRTQVLHSIGLEHHPLATQFFIPVPEKSGHFMANLPAITQYQLEKAGVSHIQQSGLDSHGDVRFYSYRQQTQAKHPFTGRMATLIFMD